MGYARYEVVMQDGRRIEAGYAVEAYCDHDDCLTKIDRGLDYLCGQTPGGDEYGCGGYFCHGHGGGGQCEDCRRDYPLCAECGEPTGGRDATYPEDLCQGCYDGLDQQDRYSSLESLLLTALKLPSEADWRPLVDQATRGVQRSWEIDCNEGQPAAPAAVVAS